MAQLRYCGWWPNGWLDESGGFPATAAEIRKGGVLKNARPVPDGLTLMVDHNGVTYTAQIAANLSEEFLILLRHILLQHWGEPMEAVEDIDIGFDELSPVALFPRSR